MEKFSIRNKYKNLRNNKINIDNNNNLNFDNKNLNTFCNKNNLPEKLNKENNNQRKFNFVNRKENLSKKNKEAKEIREKLHSSKFSYNKNLENDLKTDSKENLNLKEDKKFEQIYNLLKIIKIFDSMNRLKEDKSAVEIIPHLYIGSFACASNLEELQFKKITHILCCGVGLKLFFPDKFKYHKIDLIDKDTENIRKYFDETNNFIYDALQKQGNVLVHCYAGISRSTSIIIAYLMKHNNMNFNNALNLIKEKRGNIRPNSGFILQLKAYEKELGY